MNNEDYIINYMQLRFYFIQYKVALRSHFARETRHSGPFERVISSDCLRRVEIFVFTFRPRQAGPLSFFAAQLLQA